ncbi:MAG: lipase family protein [Limnobacter sp.]|nr:lipase family protein [Limnobacter sp.]
MTTLVAPSLVHKLSSVVYEADLAFRNIQSRNPNTSIARVTKLASKDFSKVLRETNIEFSSNNLGFMTSTSGMFQINLLSGFGFVAEGVAGRQGELILATRGTNFDHNKFDLATDANIGLAIGPRGNLVHRGFHKTFMGYRDQLIDFITDGGRRKHVGTVHCMGHSLGGALANLNASALRSAGYNVHLYTIGAPRVGQLSFAYDTTKIIPPSQICRVCNPCDPVPMVPVFPFMHASKGESEFLIRTSDKIGLEQHLLSSGYARMSSLNSWSDLAIPTPLDISNQGDLNASLQKVGGGTMFSGSALQIISNALTQLLKLAGLVALSSLQCTLSNIFTVVDVLAEALAKVAHMSILVSEKIKSIVSSLLGFLGRGFVAVKELSYSFLHWVLDMFAREMSSRARLAMDRAMSAGGRPRL